jgi:hypothetical protein
VFGYYEFECSLIGLMAELWPLVILQTIDACRKQAETKPCNNLQGWHLGYIHEFIQLQIAETIRWRARNKHGPFPSLLGQDTIYFSA